MSTPDKELTPMEQLKADLFKLQLEEVDDVRRHRREIERISNDHVEVQKELNRVHTEHVNAIEAKHAETVALLKAIIDELHALRLEAKPQVIWWPQPNQPQPATPHCPPNYPWYPWWDNPVMSSGTKTEC